ncbi:hypothetical protein E2C01_014858 [Portunus trituberculatus]|uniref:Uncharacterized protein n=1 Tax=Portunus trituberculatus TaxID=210409 RepID=A0A5B7DL22_PORTR|nr:hypothetical protein [Portunus trituberculatus]
MSLCPHPREGVERKAQGLRAQGSRSLSPCRQSSPTPHLPLDPPPAPRPTPASPPPRLVTLHEVKANDLCQRKWVSLATLRLQAPPRHKPLSD